MQKQFQKYLTFILILTLSITAVGSVSAAPSQQEVDCAETYTVQANDWLSKIAEKYYGDSLEYDTIVAATNALAESDSTYTSIDNPNVIEIGWNLCIPSLTKEGEPIILEQADEAMGGEEAMTEEMAEAMAMVEAMEESMGHSQEFSLVQGWYQGRATFYYDFGSHSAVNDDDSEIIPAPIYAFITGFDDEDNPQLVEGQHNIVDVIPGDEGYSDLWEVMFVVVPKDYVADSITTADEVLLADYEIITPDILINCPIVPAGSTLAEGGDLVQGWYKGVEIYYFDFGPNPVETAPIYALITGLDDDENPQFVEGQHNIIDVIPGDEGYSAFWQVNLVIVPQDYEADSITTAADVRASGYEMVQPGLVVNCPVIRTDDAEADLVSESDEEMMDEPAEDEGHEGSAEEAIDYELVQGWYQGRATFYYDFGSHSAVNDDGSEIIPAPIYAFITGFDDEDNPQLVEGQHNIVDVIPGDEGYSDLWEVMFVVVSKDYEANSITSVSEVMVSEYEIINSGLWVNCPIVPADSTLAEGRDLVQGWYKGEAVYYFDFGPNPVETAPIYALITGLDDDENPQFVEGQHNIIDVIPDDEGYSAFWQVNLVIVPQDYEADSITTAADVRASGYEMVQPGSVVNCPVIRTDDAEVSDDTNLVDESDEEMMDEHAEDDETNSSDTMMDTMAEAEGIAAIGEAVAIGNFVVTVAEANFVPDRAISEGLVPLIVDLTVENVGTKSENMTAGLNWYLRTVSGQAYEPDILLEVTLLANDEFFEGAIDAWATNSGTVVFEVPDAGEYIFVFNASPLGVPQEAYINLSASSDFAGFIPPVHAIGEAVTVNNLVITVNGTEAIEADGFIAPDEGYVFLGVDVTIQNTGEQDDTISDILSMYLTDITGHHYEIDISAAAATDETRAFKRDVAAGGETSGLVSFQVPEDAAGLNFTFNANPFGAPALATFALS